MYRRERLQPDRRMKNNTSVYIFDAVPVLHRISGSHTYYRPSASIWEAAAFSRNRIKKNTQKQTYGENQKGRTVITIFFDLDDTLYDQIEPFRKAYDAVFGNRFDIDIYQLFEARSVRGDEVFELAQCGKMPMDEMHIYRIQKAFEDLGYVVTDEEALRYQKLYEENQGKISIHHTSHLLFIYTL